MKLPLLLILGLTSATAFAQSAFGPPVLDGAYLGTARTLGTLNNEFATVPDFTLTEGANQTWRLTLPTGTNFGPLKATAFVIPPPGKYNIACNFGYSVVTQNYTTTQYVQQSATTGIRFLSQSIASPAFTLFSNWTTPAIAFPFQLAFGQTVSQLPYSFDSASLSAFPVTYYNRRDTIRYAGYGTLIINGQTFNNCILLKSSYTTEKASSPNGPYAYSSRHKEELIFAPGVGYPIVSHTFNIDPAEPTDVAYIGNVTTSTAISSRSSTFSFYPQPASSTVQIGLEGNGSLTIRDLLGRQVSQIAFSNGEVDISPLDPGFYQAETYFQGKFYSAKLVKE